MTTLYDHPKAYERIFGHTDPAELAFYRRMVEESQGIVVELGAGTGRILYALADAFPSRNFVGIEPNAAMFDTLTERQGARANVRLVHGGVRMLPANIGLLLTPYHVLNHVQTYLEMSSTLLAAWNNLALTGRLVVDLHGPEYDIMASEPGTKHNHDLAESYEYWETSEYDPEAQVIRFTLHWKDSEGETAYEMPAWRVWFPQEIRSYFYRHGFHFVEEHRGFPGTEQTHKLLYVLRAHL